MKKKLFLLLFVFVLSVTGCGNSVGNQSDTSENGADNTSSESMSNPEESSADPEESVTREVVFANNYLILLDLTDLGQITHNEYRPYYEWLEDSNTLYAYKIRINNWDFNEIPDYPGMEEGETDEEYIERCILQRKRIVRDLLQKEGFTLVVDESANGDIVVAATKEQMDRIFVEMKSLGNYYLRATAVMRPDIMEIMKQAGWDGIEDDYSWYEENVEKIKPLLGTEADQVTLNVSVIVPKE